MFIHRPDSSIITSYPRRMAWPNLLQRKDIAGSVTEVSQLGGGSASVPQLIYQHPSRLSFWSDITQKTQISHRSKRSVAANRVFDPSPPNASLRLFGAAEPPAMVEPGFWVAFVVPSLSNGTPVPSCVPVLRTASRVCTNGQQPRADAEIIAQHAPGHCRLIREYILTSCDIRKISPLTAFPSFFAASILPILAKSSIRRCQDAQEGLTQPLLQLSVFVQNTFSVLDTLQICWQPLTPPLQGCNDCARPLYQGAKDWSIIAVVAIIQAHYCTIGPLSLFGEPSRSYYKLRIERLLSAREPPTCLPLDASQQAQLTLGAIASGDLQTFDQGLVGMGPSMPLQSWSEAGEIETGQLIYDPTACSSAMLNLSDLQIDGRMDSNSFLNYEGNTNPNQ
ncbi:hypothetical protein EDB81DRAFT_855868 [Dactylonectria macrodidyma]|uniref:Uncharacterized protein n=1 Tax=Dactylonectria macrodidyma TaxID=307937 RepID=A0A9P9F6Y0_9HYPO|nr:hypothetical protein EDB81DRAFT_855868 [Dactylonectria macrodidyma]